MFCSTEEAESLSEPVKAICLSN